MHITLEIQVIYLKHWFLCNVNNDVSFIWVILHMSILFGCLRGVNTDFAAIVLTGSVTWEQSISIPIFTRSFHTPLRLNSSAIFYTKVNDSFSLDYLDKWIRLWLFLFRGSSMMWSPSLILIWLQRQEVHLQVKGTQKYKQTMLDNFVI
jgi:hypothetical protein